MEAEIANSVFHGSSELSLNRHEAKGNRTAITREYDIRNKNHISVE